MKEDISSIARMNEGPVLLAIYGGGSKTSAVLFTSRGAVVALVGGKPTSSNLFTDLQLSSAFPGIFEELGRKLPQASGIGRKTRILEAAEWNVKW